MSSESQKEEKEGGLKKIFKEIMSKNFPNFINLDSKK